MKRSYYYLAILSALLLILAIVARIIMIPGFLYFRDVTENIDLGNLYQRYIYTYSNDIGESLAEKARIPLFYLIYGTYKLLSLLGFGDELYVKIKILFLFISSFLCFFLSTRKLLIKYLPAQENHSGYSISLLLPPIFGAIYYTTNFWFTNRIAHFGLFFATVTVPIFFYLLYDYFFSEKKDFRKLILISLFLGVFTATPHTVLFEILIFVTIFVVYLISRNKIKENFITLFPQLLAFLIFVGLISLYWVLPYAVSNSKPDAAVSETIVRLIGKNATLTNSLGLMGYWLTEPSMYFPTKYVHPAAFIPLLLAFVSLLVLRAKRQYKLLLSLAFLFFLGTFLSTSENINNTVYFKLIFGSPIKSLGWLFREYDKFGLILAFVYSLAIVLLSYFAIAKKRYFLMFIFPFASVVALNIFFLNTTLDTNYQPVTVPNSYRTVINEISRDSSEFNVLWYPGNPKPFWVTGEEVRYAFSNLISPKPSITTRSEIINYVAFIFNLENVYSIDVGKALDLIGVKYLVVRKDDSVFKSGRVDDLLITQTSIKKLYSDELLTLYENQAFTGLVKPYTSKIMTDMGLDFLKQDVANKYSNAGIFIDYSDRPSNLSLVNSLSYSTSQGNTDLVIGKYEDRFIFPSSFSFKKEDGNPGYWKTGSLENINHSEVDFFLTSLGINISQFDYGKGVVMARDGWQLGNNIFKRGKNLALIFSNHENVKLEDGTLSYHSLDKDFNYYWNTIRSDRFDVSGMEALGVRLVSDIPEKLIPHFKFTFYSGEDTIAGITPMYQDERGLMENVIRVPKGAQTATFSIWTVSKEPGANYSYTLKNLSLEDLTGIVGPVNLSFRSKSYCLGECDLYVRVLKSAVGGQMSVSLNGKEFIFNTKLPETVRDDRYQWEYAGKVENTGDIVDVTLTNIEGFNSINALLLIGGAEAQELNQGTTGLTQLDQENLNLISGTAVYNGPLLTAKQINPTKYEIKVQNAGGGKVVMGFAKPFSKNWILHPGYTEAKLLNGYINGWEIENLQDGTYFVEYRPQKYFVIGAIISGSSAILAVLYLAVTHLRSVSPSERKSSSQG